MIIGSNFKLSNRKFLDDRQQYEGLSELNLNEKGYLFPLGFEVYCIREGKWYQNVSTDKNLPLWEERKGNGSLDIDDVIADGEVLSNKTWSSEYIDSFKTNIETLIIDNEDYIAEIEDRVLFIEGQFHWLESFDGSYNSLTDKPTIPTRTSELINDAGFAPYSELDSSGIFALKHYHDNKDLLDTITEEKVAQWDSNSENSFGGDYNYLDNKPLTYLGDDSDIVINFANVNSGNYMVNGTIGDYALANELTFIEKTDEQIIVTLPRIYKMITFELVNGVWTKINEVNYQVDKDNANISNSLNIGTNNIVGENNQIVQGKYNVEDTEGKYVNIVGNGEDENNRKNIHTLDWEGNAWYNGKVSQEGVPTEDKDLVTKGYVDGKFATSERVEKYIEDNNKENARRDVIIDALANGRRRTIDYVDGETDLFYATEKDDIFIDKIEGETLVNVCDQEEPIAITKSYTVENTNHVALQGEYDGKCRPVVYGNTLVNRNVEHDKSMVIGNAINENGTEVNIVGTVNSEVEVSLDGHTALNLGTKKGGELCKSFESASGNEIKLTTDGNSKTDVVCQGDTLVNLLGTKTLLNHCIQNSLFDFEFRGTGYQPNVIYCLNQNILTNDIITVSLTMTIPSNCIRVQLRLRDIDNNIYSDILFEEMPSDTIKTFLGKFTVDKDYKTGRSVGLQIVYTFNSKEEALGNVTITNPMIFKGDLTQTPELIPTEYVEGIQSTFEDKYIPYSIYNGDNLTSITETQYQLPLTVKTNTEYTVVTTMNTTKYQYAIYSQDSLSEYLAYENTLSTAIFSSDKANISFKVRMNPSYEGEDYNFVLDEVKDKFLIVEGDFSGRENLLTSEYFGKYKVDMRSVGKNLFDIDYVINKRTDRVEKYNNGIKIQHCLIDLTDFIKNKSKIYTLSWDAEILYKIDGKAGIGFSFVYTDGSEEYFISLKSGHNTISSNKNKTIQRFLLTFSTACTAIFTNIQLEEGTVVTEYEPYCGTTKTVYLNSPLYEGDELLTKDGKIYHYHKMGSIVLNGSEDWTQSDNLYADVCAYYLVLNSYKGGIDDPSGLITDRFLQSYYHTNEEGITSNNNDNNMNIFRIKILKSKLSTTDINGFKQWLSENPTTVVYELAKPWYEPLGEYGKVVLDGSEEIIQNALSGANYRTYLIPFSNIKIKGKCYADKIKATDGFDTGNVNESLICCSSENSQLAISSNITTLNNFKQWLQQNPVTVIYELENPQSIDDDMIFDIATSSTLSYESAVPMGTTSFLPYTNELPLLETSTQYRVSFDCDIVGLPLVISLGGTTTTITSELHNTLSIITPSIETNGKLTIDGSGIANIDNVVVTKGEMVYEYFEGLKSSFENCRKNLLDPSKLISGFINQYGNLEDSVTMQEMTSDWISVKPGEKYTFSRRNYELKNDSYYNDWASVAFFIDKSTIITRKGVSTNPNSNMYTSDLVVIIPEGCNYIRVSARSMSQETMLAQLEKGTVATEYEPYGTLHPTISIVYDNPFNFGKGGRL